MDNTNEAADESNSTRTNETDVLTGPQPKKRKKVAIAAGIVAVVLAVAGVGFWVWHETPGFCAAICHTPMDPYLASYEQEPAEGAVDKYGNTVDGSTMLASFHRVSADATCLDCHESNLGQQITEGLSWVSGSYEVAENDTYGVVITERTTTQLTEAHGKRYDEFCLNDACHTQLDRGALAQETAGMAKNPHDQASAPHGEIVECGDCHKAHTQSVMACTQCHDDAEVPTGWLAYDEAQQLKSS